jgi:hypothetical protein
MSDYTEQQASEDRQTSRDIEDDRQQRAEEQNPPEERGNRRALPARGKPATQPKEWSEPRHGHTWTNTPSGYSFRHCAFGLPCECQPAAAKPATQRKPASRRLHAASAQRSARS